jgi:hypothetical protein
VADTAQEAKSDDKRPLRIPGDAENKHILVVDDAGSGKFEHHPAGRWLVYAWTAVMRLRVGRALMVFPASCWAMRRS